MPDRSELARLVEDPTPFLRHVDPVLRRMAISALGTKDAVAHTAELARLAHDDDVSVAAAATERLGSGGPYGITALESVRTHDDATVREAAATAYGEVGGPSALAWLTEAALNDADRGVREAAVAALGAIGDPIAIDVLLDLMADGPPQVRRRAIAAITVFDDDRIEPAIIRAAFDRNPGVREAAEMVVGRQGL